MNTTEKVYEIVTKELQPPSSGHIARRLGLSPNTIPYHIRRLKKEGRLDDNLKPTGKRRRRS